MEGQRRPPFFLPLRSEGCRWTRADLHLSSQRPTAQTRGFHRGARAEEAQTPSLMPTPPARLLGLEANDSRRTVGGGWVAENKRGKEEDCQALRGDLALFIARSCLSARLHPLLSTTGRAPQAPCGSGRRCPGHHVSNQSLESYLKEPSLLLEAHFLLNRLLEVLFLPKPGNRYQDPFNLEGEFPFFKCLSIMPHGNSTTEKKKNNFPPTLLPYLLE